MKKLILFLLLCTFTARAQTPVTVTGLITDAGNNPATSGSVTFNLIPTASSIHYFVSGVGTITQQVICGIDGTGHVKSFANLANPCTVWGNDVINPANTQYKVTLAPNGQISNIVNGECITGVNYSLNNPAFCPIIQINPQATIVRANPFQTNIIPVAGGVFNVGSPLFPYASGYFNNLFLNGAQFSTTNLAFLNTNNTFTGSLTVSGTATFTGLIQCKTFENVLCVDENNTAAWAGTDAGGWLNSAYTALPASGGKIFLFGKAGGSCYAYSTPIVFNVLNKYVLVQGEASSKPGVAGAAGGACLNYTPTTATTALTMDYASGANGSAAHGLRDVMLINNQCVTSGGCGGSATGISNGGTNFGTYQGRFDGVTIMGFSVCYADLNAFSVDIVWINPTITACGTGMNLSSPTGMVINGGTIAGNLNGIQSSTTNSTPSIDLFGTQFFSNSNLAMDFTRTTGTNLAFVNCMDCHLENSTSGTAHFVQGNVDFTMMGGIAEETNSVGTTDWLFNTTGNKIWLDGVSFYCNRTCTTIATLASPTRAFISGHIGSPGHFTNYVNGANASAATLFISSGGSGTAPTPYTFEAPIQLSALGSSTGKAGYTNIWADGNNGDRLMVNPNNSGDQVVQLQSRVAGATDLGTTLLPYGNLWLGTAATNNTKIIGSATTAARNLTLPDADSLTPSFLSCGTTSTCAKTNQTRLIILNGGPIALSGGTLTITSLPFTSSTSYVCQPDDSTGINGIDVVYVSASSVTFNGTGTDSIRYTCIGN